MNNKRLSCNSRYRWYWGIIISVSLSACSQVFNPLHRNIQQTLTLQQCDNFYTDLADLIDIQKINDRQAVKIAHFPYLRTNRFLSSFRDEITADQQAPFHFWLELLREQAENAWQVEIANLNQHNRQWISAKYSQILKADLVATETACANILMQYDMALPENRQYLLQHAITPSSYSSIKRFFGIYPLTKKAMEMPINKSYRKVQRNYYKPLQQLPVKGELVRYTTVQKYPAKTTEIKAILKLSANNPFHIPRPGKGEIRRLFEAFAPIYEIDVAHPDDYMGKPVWPSYSDKPTVDITRPTVFRHISYTRFAGKILLQLNYVNWLPARTHTGWIDKEAGNMSSIIWRVTLDEDGIPLIYDSIHSCGCYHMFYPTNKVKIRKRKQKELGEKMFAPQQDTDFPVETPLILRVAHKTHFIDRVYPYLKPKPKYDDDDTINTLKKQKKKGLLRSIAYQFADYQQLRSMDTLSSLRRSLFDSHGMVVGSERLIGNMAWPIGVYHLGAMMQWGNQPTAFTGERHFDDAYLLDRYFYRSSLSTTRP